MHLELPSLGPPVPTNNSLISSTAFCGINSSRPQFIHVQLIYGPNLGKITALGPGIQDPTSNAAAPTKKEFAKGGFVGLTVNFGFIKSLFSSGSSK